MDTLIILGLPLVVLAIVGLFIDRIINGHNTSSAGTKDIFRATDLLNLSEGVFLLILTIVSIVIAKALTVCAKGSPQKVASKKVPPA